MDAPEHRNSRFAEICLAWSHESIPINVAEFRTRCELLNRRAASVLGYSPNPRAKIRESTPNLSRAGVGTGPTDCRCAANVNCHGILVHLCARGVLDRLTACALDLASE